MATIHGLNLVNRIPHGIDEAFHFLRDLSREDLLEVCEYLGVGHPGMRHRSLASVAEREIRQRRRVAKVQQSAAAKRTTAQLVDRTPHDLDEALEFLQELPRADLHKMCRYLGLTEHRITTSTSRSLALLARREILQQRLVAKKAAEPFSNELGWGPFRSLAEEPEVRKGRPHLTRTTTFTGQDVTHVILGLGEFRGGGLAKRHPDDTPDRKIGAQLATARALIDLGKKMEADAHKRSRQ